MDTICETKRMYEFVTVYSSVHNGQFRSKGCISIKIKQDNFKFLHVLYVNVTIIRMLRIKAKIRHFADFQNSVL